jgi:hypothetical protein
MYNILHFCEKGFNDLLMFFIQCNYWKRYVLIQSIFNELYLRNASCKFLMLKIIELLWECDYKDYFDWHNIHATSFSMYMSMTFRIFICIIFYIFVKKVGIKQLTKIKCFTASARKHCY